MLSSLGDFFLATTTSRCLRRGRFLAPNAKSSTIHTVYGLGYQSANLATSEETECSKNNPTFARANHNPIDLSHNTQRWKKAAKPVLSLATSNKQAKKPSKTHINNPATLGLPWGLLSQGRDATAISAATPLLFPPSTPHFYPQPWYQGGAPRTGFLLRHCAVTISKRDGAERQKQSS